MDRTRYQEKLPLPEMMLAGLRSIGYEFETAVADIIDNSVAAQASSVDVSLIRPRPNLISRFVTMGPGCLTTNWTPQWILAPKRIGVLRTRGTWAGLALA
jgi:hypothetical protein